MNNRIQVQKYCIVLCIVIIIGIIAMSACGNPTNTPPARRPNPMSPNPMNPNPMNPNPTPPAPMNYVPSHITRNATITMNPGMSVVNIQFPERIYLRFFHSFDNFMPDITRFLYSHFADHFDFIFYSYNEDIPPPALDFVGAYYTVSNDVMGIGSPQGAGDAIHNDASQYGSADELQGIIQFTTRTGLTTGPGLHEIMHRWGNYVIPTPPIPGVSSHWGFSSAGGQLGGFDFDTLMDLGSSMYSASVADFEGFGAFAQGGNSVPYSPIELYLAGLIPPSEVPDLHVAIEPMFTDDLSSRFSATRFEIYSIERIIEEHGARVPDHNNSQKEFRVLFVVLSPRALTTEEWTEVGRITQEFSRTAADADEDTYNFWEATGGRASIQFGGLAESLIREPSTSPPEQLPMIDSPVVGTWSFSPSDLDLTETIIFEENGNYSNWLTYPSDPADLGEQGVYSIMSDSMLRFCIEYEGGNVFAPPICYTRSYSIMDSTLTLGEGDANIDGDQIRYLPRTLSKQTTESIVGSWERFDSFSMAKRINTYSEDGGYLEFLADDPVPLNRGTYRNISGSSNIEICITHAEFDNVTVDPPLCFETPYRIVDNALILEPIRIPAAFDRTILIPLPETIFIRQAES